MPLNRQQIRAALDAGQIAITNLQPNAIQPNSVDLSLGENLYIPRGRGRLTTTNESIYLGPGHCGWILTRSTPARKGLTTATALWFDEGWNGVPNLELYYFGSLDPAEWGDPRKDEAIQLLRGDPVAQLIIMHNEEAAELQYGCPELGSRYQGQRGPTYARGWDV